MQSVMRIWPPSVVDHGDDTRLGAFTQAFGTTALDASVLVIPLVSEQMRQSGSARIW